MNRIEIPIRILSEANNTDHWTKKHKRKKIQSFLIKHSLKNVHIPVPVTINLIRQGVTSHMLDFDNLVACMKFPKDIIADLILPGLPPGRADGDHRISWKYDQQKGKSYALIVEIYN